MRVFVFEYLYLWCRRSMLLRVVDCNVSLYLIIYISDADGRCCLEHWEESLLQRLYLSIYISDVHISSRWSMLLGALEGGSLYLLQALGSRQSLYFLVIVLTLGDPSSFEKENMRNLFLLEMRSYKGWSTRKQRNDDDEKKYCALLRSWTSDLEHLSPAWTSLQNIAPLCQTYPVYPIADLPEEPYLAVSLWMPTFVHPSCLSNGLP